MAFGVGGVVDPLAEVRVLQWGHDVRPGRPRALEMRVDVFNVDAQALRRGPEFQRAFDAVGGPNGPQHDLVRAELQPCMTNGCARRRFREQLDETEAGAQGCDRSP
jgi:hypothetical protein